MAITKIKVITTRLDRTVNYVLNENKTDLSNVMEYILNGDKTASGEKILFESAINCVKKTAFKDMIRTKNKFDKLDKILGYHVMQSFKPNETTPDIAHEIGIKFANECFGEQYEIVIGTHLDKDHLHNHIIFNSVSLVDGKKYRNNLHDYYGDIRGVSDRLCKEYGLSVVPQTADKTTLTYSEWLAKNKGRMSWQALIRMDIDDAVKQAFNYGNFLVLMQNKGYEIKQGKYLAVKPYGKERFSRTYKLGDDYDEETIRAKILGKDLRKEISQYTIITYDEIEYYQKGKAKGFTALCLHYMYLLGVIKRNKAPEKVSLLLKEDLLKFEAMSKTFNFLTDRNLHTYDDVINYKSKCEETILLLRQDKINHKKELIDKNNIYKALVNFNMYKQAHTLFEDGYTGMNEENEKFTKAEQILKNNGCFIPSHFKALEVEYSKHLERSSKYDGDIRHFQYEVSMCDKSITTEQYVRKQMQKIKKQEEHKEMKNNRNINK